MNNRTKHLTTAWMLVCVAALSASAAAPPAPYEATIQRFTDADTFVAKQADGSEVKIRLHYADAPEIAHNKKQQDQPHGRAALAYANKHWLNAKATITPRGKSYDRIVADVDIKHEDYVSSMAIELVAEGYAMLDPRFKPPEILRLNQELAKMNKKGVWTAKKPTPPWEWRKKKGARDMEFISFGVPDGRAYSGPDGDCDHHLGEGK